MRLMIVSDAGEVLDSENITREEWDNMGASGALALLQGLQIGDAR